LAKIIGCGAGSRQGKSTEIEDDPVPCPVCPRNRLCIPLCEGEYGEVYIFKTPYHEDFKNDLHESMVHVGLATSAAPTYYRPRQAGGYTFVDGGVWSNNPTMIALTEALTSFDITREQVRILTIGCGDDPYTVGRSKVTLGGMWHWRDIIRGPCDSNPRMLSARPDF
jgi:hypothetical protein